MGRGTQQPGARLSVGARVKSVPIHVCLPANSALDAAAVWPIALLGVPFDPVTLPGAVHQIAAMVEARTPHYVVTANVDFLVQARRDPELRRILVSADLVLCDGTPLVWASRWLGNSLPGRVAGADLVPLLLQRAAVRGWRIFLLGAAPGVGEEAARRIAAQYPALPAIAHYSPPFRPLHEMNHAEIAARIRAVRPDLLLVSFGCPKQEKWISMHYGSLGVPVAIGVGATVDFLAGRVRRAPRWMQRSGTEWIFRMAREPRRLVRRYADDVRHFFPALFAQHRDLPPSAPDDWSAYGPLEEETCYGLKVRACEQLDRNALAEDARFWQRALDQRGHCLVDLGEVRAIDSTGLALLASWQKRLAKHRRNLILFRPSAAVRAALEQAGLADQFIVTDGLRPGQQAAARERRLATP
jgi:exopolysaccharide biosynthesis WecB/TagA/CpsF family protein/anti-anti-sigma factor